MTSFLWFDVSNLLLPRDVVAPTVKNVVSMKSALFKSSIPALMSIPTLRFIALFMALSDKSTGISSINSSDAFSLIRSAAFRLSCWVVKPDPFFFTRSSNRSFTTFVDPSNFSLLPASAEKIPSSVAIALPKTSALFVASFSLTP